MKRLTLGWLLKEQAEIILPGAICLLQKAFSEAALTIETPHTIRSEMPDRYLLSRYLEFLLSPEKKRRVLLGREDYLADHARLNLLLSRTFCDEGEFNTVITVLRQAIEESMNGQH